MPVQERTKALHAFDTSLEEDLKALSALFRQQGIGHRIFERQGRQVVEVYDAAHLPHVLRVYEAFRSGDVQLSLEPIPRGAQKDRPLTQVARELPIFTLVACCAIGLFPVAMNYLGMGDTLTLLSYMPQTEFAYRDPVNAVWLNLQTGELWRLVTPIFLHFSVAHIAFNLAMLYEFGRRLEVSIAPVIYLAAILFIATVSNTAQFLVISHASFGGLSGVVYGLFGALVVLGRRYPESALLRLQDGFILVLLVILVLFSSGITERFGLNIANTAHWGGFFSGLLFGALVPIRDPGEASRE